MIFNSSPQSIPKPIQGVLSTCTLLSLHTPATSTITTTTTQQQQQQCHPQRKWSMGTLAWKGSEPILNWCNPIYTNLETLCRTYLAPLLCLATLVHVLYHFHILLCHSRFPNTMPCLLLPPCYTTSQNPTNHPSFRHNCGCPHMVLMCFVIRSTHQAYLIFLVGEEGSSLQMGQWVQEELFMY